MSFKRSISGRKAKRTGQAFENIIEVEASRSNMVILRIPDGCKQVSSSNFIRIKSPFDFVLVCKKTEKTLFFDAKSTSANTFSPPLIKPHQLNALSKFSGLDKIKTGYIVNFEKHCKVVFFTYNQLKNSMVTRKGLKPDDGISLGHKHLIDFRNLFL